MLYYFYLLIIMSIRTIEDVISLSTFLTITATFVSFLDPSSMKIQHWILLLFFHFINFYFIFLYFKNKREEKKIIKKELDTDIDMNMNMNIEQKELSLTKTFNKE